MMTIMVHDVDDGANNGDDDDDDDNDDDDILASGVIRILVRSRCNASEQKQPRQKRTHITPTFHLISQRPRIILTPTSDQKNWDSPN